MSCIWQDMPILRSPQPHITDVLADDRTRECHPGSGQRHDGRYPATPDLGPDIPNLGTASFTTPTNPQRRHLHPSSRLPDPRAHSQERATKYRHTSPRRHRLPELLGRPHPHAGPRPQSTRPHSSLPHHELRQWQHHAHHGHQNSSRGHRQRDEANGVF